MTSPDYGLGDRNNRLVGIIEAALREFDKETKFQAVQMAHEGATEILDICAEGVSNFEKASVGITPLQRVITGAKYTLNALEEWRSMGPLYRLTDD